MEAHGWEDAQLLLIHYLDTRYCEWSASRPGRTLPPGKWHLIPIGQEAGWDTESVWIRRLEERSSCLFRGSTLNSPVVQSVVRHWATTAPQEFLVFNVLQTKGYVRIIGLRKIRMNKTNKFRRKSHFLYTVLVTSNTFIVMGEAVYDLSHEDMATEVA
jgi:hypothetical protein